MKKDEPMDRLLERALRPADHARPHGACLEAETLAAWTDGSLTPAQRSAAEAHAADCDRCLAVLAAIARTTPPPSEAQRSSWFSVRWVLPLATAAVAIIAWAVVEAPRDAGPEIDSIAPVAVEPAKPAASAPQTERDITAQARTGAAAEQQKKEEAPPTAAPRAKTQLESRRAEANKEEPRRTPPSAAAAPPPPVAEPHTRTLGAVQQAPIVSPDPNVRWRILATAVERSIDGGNAWTPQSTGTQVPLLAGASPDPRVCWIVGRSGVVLLSTDGETWRRLDFPDSQADLVAIIATNALSAAVTTADGRTYRTEDGGKRWRLQENSAAAF